MYLFFFNVMGVFKINGCTFHVVSKRDGTQCNGTCILLFCGHILIYLLGKFTGTNNEQTCSQRIKRSCMAYFFYTDGIADLSNRIKGSPMYWLINEQNLP